jgi:uncharacterized protein (TIGR00251 family)
VTNVEALVKPRSKVNRLTVTADQRLSIAVTSPPADGKANEHARRLLASALRVPPSAVTIVRGHTARHKVLAVEGMGREEILQAVRGSTQR